MTLQVGSRKQVLIVEEDKEQEGYAPWNRPSCEVPPVETNYRGWQKE
jgi:hypothetical protein